MPRTLKFLHLADVHLDRPLTGGKLRLPYDKAERRAREYREAFARAIESARASQVEVILIAGDLWEEDNLAADTVSFVIETLERAGMPVFLAPGNHDHYSPSSHYASEFIAARYGRPWPENVHVFRSYDFEHLTAPNLEGVVFTGLAYRSNQPVSLRRLGERIELPEADLHIALIHGSRDDHLPPGKMRTLPFSDAELLRQPFDYVALGHYHSSARINGSDARIRAAYPGSLCSGSTDETGLRGGLVGIVGKGGVEPDNLSLLEFDARRIHHITLDITGCRHIGAAEQFITEKLTPADVRVDDIVNIELTGIFPSGNRMQWGEDFLKKTCFHLRIDSSAVRPEWDLEEDSSAPPKTTEAIYRQRMKKLIETALERGDEAEAARLQNALFYGLDALHSQTIAPRSSG